MSEANAENTSQNAPEPSRNEPCPCGSGKKYKRCHGVNAPPKLSSPAAAPGTFAQAAGMPGGMPFDPSQLDPQWMAQFTGALQRLPRGQLQRLQAMMQKAMSGGDVSREAAEFEKTLPPDLQALMSNFQMPGMPSMADMAAGGAGAAPAIPVESSAAMDLEEAKRIVAAAAAEGKLSEEQATELLGAPREGEKAPDSEGASKFGKLFRSWKK